MSDYNGEQTEVGKRGGIGCGWIIFMLTTAIMGWFLIPVEGFFLGMIFMSLGFRSWLRHKVKEASRQQVNDSTSLPDRPAIQERQ